MNLACTVCYEILKSSDNIHAAPCGHLLHFHCWMGWLERMRNCPECRKPTLPNQLIRLFFNNGEGDDYCTLRNKYDSLRCELQCKISEVETSNALLEKQKGEILDLKITGEKELDKFRSEIADLKVQLNLSQKCHHEEEHRLKDQVKILEKQNEATQIQYLRFQKMKEIEERELKEQIRALKKEKKMIARSKEEELERLREEQKTNLRFLQQFSKGNEKLVEKLLFLAKTAGANDAA